MHQESVFLGGKGSRGRGGGIEEAVAAVVEAPKSQMLVACCMGISSLLLSLEFLRGSKRGRGFSIWIAFMQKKEGW